MSSATLLVELFTEELPPKALKRLGDAFAEGIATGLNSRGLLESNHQMQIFATPRRLAVTITNARAIAPDESFSEKLMPVAVGLDKDGKATPALLKKLAAKSLSHVEPSQLLRESDGKAEQLIYRGIAKGQSLHVGLEAALALAISGLPVPKLMSYQLADGVTTVQFVRPAHGLVALHGEKIIPVHALGLTAGRTTHGHRFQGAADIELKDADEYESRLENEGGVIASFDKRRAEIMRLLFAHAEQAGDTLGEPEDYAALLDEVTGLVERPTVYVGKFDAEFLEVPPECLVLTMKLNQKYFPLFLSEGGLSSRFLIVSNMRLDDPRNVIEGNERVVRPRLADARFFFETDKKTKLADRLPKLTRVTYQAQLGSQFLRVQRILLLSQTLARKFAVDAGVAARAALLCKADLLSDMVAEFPELQGTMGKYYALNDGESVAVATAIADHYLPRFAGDSLPTSEASALISVADRMISLVALFYAGSIPTGDKDPFALRRAALGVLRILIDKKIPISISALVNDSAEAIESKRPFEMESPIVVAYERARQRGSGHLTATGYGFSKPAVSDAVRQSVAVFIAERLVGLLKDFGYLATEVDSVLADQEFSFHNILDRLEAVKSFFALPEALGLAAANKRIGNILKKAKVVPESVNPKLLTDPAEKALFEAMKSTFIFARRAYEAGNYAASLHQFASLKEPVDIFFDQVMVNADDPEIRANRLGLLATLHREMNLVADLSKLAA